MTDRLRGLGRPSSAGGREVKVWLDRRGNRRLRARGIIIGKSGTILVLRPKRRIGRRQNWRLYDLLICHFWRSLKRMDRRNQIAVSLLSQLERRRKELGMTKESLSEHTGLGSRTVQRVLSGQDAGATLGTILAIADALKVRLETKSAPAHRVKREQAMKKAAQLATMVQGTSALEAQAIPKKALQEIRQEIAASLISGSGRQLWG